MERCIPRILRTPRGRPYPQEDARAQELDPLSLYVGISVAWPLHYSGRFDQAAKQIERGLEMYPKDPSALNYLHYIRGESLLARGLEQKAAEEFIESEAAACASCLRVNPEAITALKTAYRSAGLRGYWQKDLELQEERYRKDSEKAQAEGEYVSPITIAKLYARLGRKDKAFALLELAFQNRDESVLNLKAESIRTVSATSASDCRKASCSAARSASSSQSPGSSGSSSISVPSGRSVGSDLLAHAP